MKPFNGQARAWAVLAFLCCCAPGQATEIPNPLALEVAITLARENHPLIRAARSEIQMREAEVVDRRQRLNPANSPTT